MELHEDRIDLLKKRAKRCCCKYCGSRLQIRRIVYGKFEDARVEIFCSNCNRIEFGIEPEIYQIAKYFVEEMKYNAYPDLDTSEKTKEMSIAKATEIISWGCQNLGIIGEDGFVVPIYIDKDLIGETIVIRDEDLPIVDVRVK